MWRAGLRVGEVCALRVRDVNLATGEVRIEEGKGADGESAYFDPALVSPMLERWLSMRKRLGFDNARTLFCTVKSSDTPMGGHKRAGGPVSRRQIQDMVKRRARTAGVDPTKVTPHKLRHTFATELLNEGLLNIREVQRALRHANLGTTELYTHVLDTDLRAKIQGRSSRSSQNANGGGELDG